ncbi:MAG: hypothetical protein LBH43_03730 [Treponema sp.]|jgi:hypothetical protein|nr:hypothetical protein [Treponema sp.]
MKSFAKTVAMVLAVVIAANSVTGCIFMNAAMPNGNGIGYDGYGGMTWAVKGLDVVIVICLVVSLLNVPVTKKVKDKQNRSVAVIDTINSLPESERGLILDTVDSFSEKEIELMLETVDALSGAEYDSLMDKICTLSEKEIASSVAAYNSLNNVQRQNAVANALQHIQIGVYPDNRAYAGFRYQY